MRSSASFWLVTSIRDPAIIRGRPQLSWMPLPWQLIQITFPCLVFTRYSAVW